MLKILTVIVLVFLFNTTFAQKTVRGDTAFWYNYKKPLVELFEFENLLIDSNEYIFRFWNHGQAVQIIKNGNQFEGTLVNYVFFRPDNKKKPRETFFQKSKIADSNSRKLHEYLEKKNLSDVPTDDSIARWSHGLDGITYILEFSKPSVYVFNNYWTPSSQKNIPEAKQVQDFVNYLYSVLRLDSMRFVYKVWSRKKGTYSNGGTVVWGSMKSKRLAIGYYGSTRLPIGYQLTYSLPMIQNKDRWVGFSLSHLLGGGSGLNTKNYDFKFKINKRELFFKQQNGRLSDMISYTTRFRYFDWMEENIFFNNHKLLYEIPGSKRYRTSLGFGPDLLLAEQTYLGGMLKLNTSLLKDKLGIAFQATIFKNQIDYRIELFSSVDIGKRNIRRIYYNFGLENFRNYTDIFFGFRYYP